MPALDKLRRIGFHNSVVEASNAWVSGDDEVAHLPLPYLEQSGGDKSSIQNWVNRALTQINSVVRAPKIRLCPAICEMLCSQLLCSCRQSRGMLTTVPMLGASI